MKIANGRQWVNIRRLPDDDVDRARGRHVKMNMSSFHHRHIKPVEKCRVQLSNRKSGGQKNKVDLKFVEVESKDMDVKQTLKRDSWRQWSKVGNKFLKAPLFFCVVVGLLGEWTKKAILRASDVSLSWQPQSNIPAPSSYFEQKFHSQEVNINEPCSRAHLNQFKWKSTRV